jgi:hypothetical protein
MLTTMTPKVQSNGFDGKSGAATCEMSVLIDGFE